MKKIVMFVLIMTIISLMSVSFTDTDSNPDKFFVGIDGSVEISIEENPTTGYIWHLKIDNDELVKIVVDEFTASNAEGVVGAGGMHTWIIDAVDQGIVTMTIEYYRDWEPENVAETREYVINIVPNGEKEVYINDFIADEAIPELISVEVEEAEKLNLFQRFIGWIVNLFK